jgi:hypothetical protein
VDLTVYMLGDAPRVELLSPDVRGWGGTLASWQTWLLVVVSVLGLLLIQSAFQEGRWRRACRSSTPPSRPWP